MKKIMQIMATVMLLIAGAGIKINALEVQGKTTGQQILGEISYMDVASAYKKSLFIGSALVLSGIAYLSSDYIKSAYYKVFGKKPASDEQARQELADMLTQQDNPEQIKEVTKVVLDAVEDQVAEEVKEVEQIKKQTRPARTPSRTSTTRTRSSRR